MTRKPPQEKTTGKTNTRTLPQIVKAIKALEKKSIQNVVEIGKLLHEASEKCKQGEYATWLKSEFSWSDQTALNYRYVYNLTRKPNNLDFAKLNISISAVYFLARLLRDGTPSETKIAKAIIEAAKRDRVTYPIAGTIFEKMREDDEPAPPAKAKSDPPADSDDDDSDEDDSDDDSPAVEFCPESDNPLDRVWGVGPLRIVLEQLNDLLRDPKIDWTKLIEATGSEKIHEILYEFKSKFDQYNQDKEVKVKADRAEHARH